MIVITGATGALNGATVDRLLDLVPATDVAVVARDVTKARRFADLGVTVRHGDYADPASLPGAFDGADQLLLVSSSDPGADAVALHRTAIDAAVAAGAGRILYTSHQNAVLETPFKPGRDHAATERLLAESGLPWTSLRNGFYLHSLAWLAGPWRETGVISVPGDGPVSWTSRDDAAAAAAQILASNGKYDGPTTITATSAPTFAEIAGIASEVTGRTITLDILDDQDWLAAQIAGGTQEFMARFVLGFYQAARRGDFAGVDPLLGTLLDGEPATVRDFLSR
ncbi:NmrA family NAD(P)-binding protein [Actinoplanes sp. NBRC 101535]|uniref:NmrA family NAD(P)-binding protein n=1 Tax=Actinoplanes sp. NBRC 101535 TaxID=3032196 RepID=UPI0024A08B79|nr:NmrA family NAD(P)-binding protein [Actinoplanes sp. NBRC 101535]GLY07833.1 NmrA family transcriptional regulator [Actinoplanes sp. NBRC 101535]